MPPFSKERSGIVQWLCHANTKHRLEELQMKAIVSFLVICAIGGLAGSAFGWQEIQRLRAENLALKAQARESAAKASESLEALEASHESKVKKLEAEAKEVFKLRGEVSLSLIHI